MIFWRSIVLLTTSVISLSGCISTGLSVASTGVAIGTPKHGWFKSSAKLTDPNTLKKLSAPLSLSLKTRIIFQGVDLEADGTIEESLEWVFKDGFEEQITKLFDSTGVALISDRGLDGEAYVEISLMMEDFGFRYLPFVAALRWTEKKIGKMRITLTNHKDQSVTSLLQEENVYVQTGLFADSPQDMHKQAVFEIPRVDFTIKGETVAIDKLTEQLFYRCIEKIQEKVNLEDFFATPPSPETSSSDVIIEIIGNSFAEGASIKSQ